MCRCARSLSMVNEDEEAQSYRRTSQYQTTITPTTCVCFFDISYESYMHEPQPTKRVDYDRGFSLDVSTHQENNQKMTHFFSFQRARRPTPATLTTLNRTPGISPFAFPRRPKPEIKTSSFSSVKLRQPSLGTNAVTFFPFLMS